MARQNGTKGISRRFLQLLFDIRYQVRQTGAGSLPSRTHNLLIAAPKNSFSKQIKRLQNNFDDDDDDKAIT